MDPSEKIVSDFLTHRGYKNIVHEPDGKVIPDFLVDGHIAVEVRRLNQNYEAGTRPEGLEELSIPLRQKIEKLALSLGPPVEEVSWFLSFRFRRPAESWPKLKLKLQRVLEEFRNSATHVKTRWSLGNGFQLEIFRATNPHPTFYVMGGYNDLDAGGWLEAEMENNLRLCICQKTKLIESSKLKYPKW